MSYVDLCCLPLPEGEEAAPTEGETVVAAFARSPYEQTRDEPWDEPRE